MKYSGLTWPLLAINRLLISNYRNIDVIRQSINVNIHYSQCNCRKCHSTQSNDLAQRAAIVVGAIFISHKVGSNSKVNLLVLSSDHILYIGYFGLKYSLDRITMHLKFHLTGVSADHLPGQLWHAARNYWSILGSVHQVPIIAEYEVPGSVNAKVCLTLQHMTSAGNRAL